MSADHVNEELVVAHVADNVTEAMVIRGLLQSAGIDSPGSVSSDPFPIPENPEGPHGTEIFVLESQVRRGSQSNRGISEKRRHSGARVRRIAGAILESKFPIAGWHYCGWSSAKVRTVSVWPSVSAVTSPSRSVRKNRTPAAAYRSTTLSTGCPN